MQEVPTNRRFIAEFFKINFSHERKIRVSVIMQLP